jgi:hypothetical protein
LIRLNQRRGIGSLSISAIKRFSHWGIDLSRDQARFIPRPDTFEGSGFGPHVRAQAFVATLLVFSESDIHEI